MNTETMLARILPAIEEVIKEVVSQVVASSASATLYDLEEQTQTVLPRIGQVLLQGFVPAQGAGVVGQRGLVPAGRNSITMIRRADSRCRAAWAPSSWSAVPPTSVRHVLPPAIRLMSSWGWARPDG